MIEMVHGATDHSHRETLRQTVGGVTERQYWRITRILFFKNLQVITLACVCVTATTSQEYTTRTLTDHHYHQQHQSKYLCAGLENSQAKAKSQMGDFQLPEAIERKLAEIINPPKRRDGVSTESKAL